jgi:hypothetical protein
MFMHHITLCTPYIALVNDDHLLHMRVDHAELEAEVQKGRKTKECSELHKPQVAIILSHLGSRHAPVHPTKVLIFYI